MASSPVVPPVSGRAKNRTFGKTRLLMLVVLLALLALCIALSIATEGAVAYLHRESKAAAAAHSLVDLRPWQTAQALASLAVSAEENEYAREAERLADHEVDQAFAAALRQARLDAQHRQLSGSALRLAQKIAQIEQLQQQDQALVDRLQATAAGGKTTAAGAAQTSESSGDLDVAKAQLGLDHDELADAQRALAFASGDHSGQIQEELAAHEASMKEYDSQVARGGQMAVLAVAHNRTLAARLGAWFRQRQRQSLLDQALQEAQGDARQLAAETSALEARANADEASANASSGAPDRAARLTQIENRGTERQILNIDDDRGQTERHLANVYAQWLVQVKLQHRIVLHLILRSLALILVLLLAMLLCDALVRTWLARPGLEKRRMRTLRSVLEISIQAIGLALILVVVFGTPRETPTILGLATAALTIALQDYIVAFLGWFVLMGKNGIHVGDWVEINGVSGEVIEIGLMTTVLLETGGMAEHGLPTGRRIAMMNGYAIRGQYFNFSTAGQWMWDEIPIQAPADADLHDVIEKIQKAAAEETRENAQSAEAEWAHPKQGEGLSRCSAQPVVHAQPAGGNTELRLRYVTTASRRFEARNRIYRRVLELLQDR